MATLQHKLNLLAKKQTKEQDERAVAKNAMNTKHIVLLYNAIMTTFN